MRYGAAAKELTFTEVIRLPKTLACTVIQCASMATLGCSGQTSEHADASTTDAAMDVAMDVAMDAEEAGADVFLSDAPLDCGDEPPTQCGPPGMPCSGYICGSDCIPPCSPPI
jgi:hypothetical protein